MSSEHTIIVMDDIAYWKPWGAGLSAVWAEAVGSDEVLQEELFRMGNEYMS